MFKTKLPYHCVISYTKLHVPITLCGYKALDLDWTEGAGHVFDKPKKWFKEWKDFDYFWSKYERCKDCLNHEDYPLIALAHV